MTAFKFPPPPPPPPKAPVHDTQQPYTSQRGGHGRGRNERGGGRGGHASQRGGSQSHVGNARGGHSQNNARGHSNSRGGYRGDQQNHRGGGQARGGSTPMVTTPTPPVAIPHVNPAFLAHPQWGGHAQPPVVPHALAQAMSFMATPAGQQSMAAFASHMAGLGDAASQHSSSSPSHYAQPASRHSPPQHAGQKRKLNDRKSNAQPPPPRKPPQQGSKATQQSSKPPRAKAAVPPPVPSFGFSLPPPPVVRPLSTPKGMNKKDWKKGKMNLGLTHHPMPEESSEDEDIDEEAAFAAKLKGGGFVFEHEGEQITIQTAAEVSAWVKDRRKNFPTQKRIMEKAHDAAVKRTAELDFLRKLKGRPPIARDVPGQERLIKAHDKSQDKTRKDGDEQRRQEKLAALRRRLHESMLEKQTGPSTIDFGLGYSTETESDNDSSVLSESSVVSSSEDSSDESDMESDESDAAPEPTSSKVGPPPIKVPRPLPSQNAQQSTQTTDTVCKDWARHGRCSFSHKCKFAHPPKEEEKRMGLFEVMVEQELVKADQLALDAIKYLGQHGFLG